MKKQGLLHAELNGILAGMGHTQTVVIGDAGLPVPEGVPCVDLAVRTGLPPFLEVLEAVLEDYVFEACVVAEEIQQKNPMVLEGIQRRIAGLPLSMVSHETLKQQSRSSLCVIRTGETSPYANIVLVGGVNF